jgi:RNA polymerase sigma factor (TIGR02999 family)
MDRTDVGPISTRARVSPQEDEPAGSPWEAWPEASRLGPATPGGGRAATAELFAIAYDQLKRLARAQRRRLSGSTLNTTALVHEAFLKLERRGALVVRDRAHFLATAALAMRQILVDRARREIAAKRGGVRRPISFDRIEEALKDVSEFSPERAEALLALDESLRRLAKHSERHSRVVQCRFFAGMSIRETAVALHSSPATVKRDWALAQAWLLRDLEGKR